MLELTARAEVNGQKFDGIDYFLFLPHTDPKASDGELRKIADLIQGYGFNVGSLVAPVWPGTVGDSAMGDDAARKKFLDAVKMACRIAGVFNKHGVRKYGVIRIDSAEFGVAEWRKDPKTNTKRIAETFREAAKIAADHGERLAAEGEICWAGMHSWKAMLDLLEEVGMPETLGFQADMAHTYLYLMGYNAPEARAAKAGLRRRSFTPPTRRWSTSCGHGRSTSTWRKTTARCTAPARTTRRASTARPNDPNGKLDIVRCAGYWLKDAPKRGIQHICWDGCMFPNAMLETQKTWNEILDVMLKVRAAHGWKSEEIDENRWGTAPSSSTPALDLNKE